MTKIKLSLPSGSEVEKTVLSYFNNGGNYLVLDAESVGSMGLPIILVSKVSDKVEKIVDQNEWQQVKGYLKNIISGGQTTYLATPDSIPADETYYTQLTLPVASFDALKNFYSVPAETPASVEPAVDTVAAPSVGQTEPVQENSEVVTPVAPIPEAPVVEAPVANDPVVADPIAAPVDESIVTDPAITDIPVPEEAPAAPAADTPAVDMEPVNMSTEVPVETPVPQVNDTEVVGDVSPVEESMESEAPIINEGLNSSVDNTSVSEIPTVDVEPVASAPELPVVDEVAPTPEVTVEASNNPIADPIVENQSDVATPELPPIGDNVVSDSADINSIKQKFMSACEELFDSIASLK